MGRALSMLLHSGPCDGRTAAAVRRRIRDLQAALEIRTRAVEDLELVATELVANAVAAGARWLDARLEVAPRAARLEVTDDAPGRPVPRAAGPSDSHGRGLTIVAALADEWGVQTVATGKTVWVAFVA